jgi:hypothetical protein
MNAPPPLFEHGGDREDVCLLCSSYRSVRRCGKTVSGRRLYRCSDCEVYFERGRPREER